MGDAAGTRVLRLLCGLFLAMAVMLAVTGASLAASSSVSVVGEYPNMRFTAEHAYGYTVQLWREGDRLFGLLLASDGLQGDTPTGLLENVVFDPRTGALSFTVRLTTGLAYLGPGNSVPSRDLFEFRGTLGTEMLAGAVSRSACYDPTPPRWSNRSGCAGTRAPS